MNQYHFMVPSLIQSLKNLLVLLAKAERYAKERKFDPALFLNAKLAPDMFDLTKQIQYTYFLALDAGSKLSGKKEPVFDYQEKTLKELKESINRTIRYLRALRPKDFEGAEKKNIAIFFLPKKHLAGDHYVTQLALPDFYFHYAMAYAILRHGGVAIGKDDYLGPLKLQ